MKCSNCGAEIKDDVKFCPNCGEEVKEEKKIKYCMKCGSELIPDSMFCSECGASIAGEQKKEKSPKPNKPVKKVLGVIGILVVLVLIVGCFMINSDKAMYKAYVKFHDEYCDKNLNYEEFNDCAAKIIMAPDNKKWLAIFDIVNANDEFGKIKTTLYQYSWGKVRKIVTFSKEIDDDNFSDYFFQIFSLIDNELYFFTREYRSYWNPNEIIKKGNLKGVYRLNEKNKFEVVKVKEENEKNDNGDEDSVYYLESGMRLDKFLFLSNCEDSFLITNSISVTEVNEFADVMKELSKYKIKNQADLQIAYGKIFRDFGLMSLFYEEAEIYEKIFTDYPVVGTMKTEYGYYNVRTSGNVALAGLTEKGNLDKALKSADGRKVTGIEGGFYENIPKNFKIPDNITYIGEMAFWGCENLRQVEIPDSVEKIGKDIFWCGDMNLPPIIIASEGSYAHQYAEENDLEWSAKELSKEELEERKLIGEVLNAYDKWLIGNSEERYEYDYTYITMCYLDNDNIPECIVWCTDQKDMPISTTFFVLSYKNGEIVKVKCDSTDSGYKEFFYTPRSGNFIYTLWNHVGRGREIYNLSNDFVRTDEIAVSLYRGEEKFIINGEAVDSEETVEKYVRDKGFTNGFTEEDLYHTVKEAYQNLT